MLGHVGHQEVEDNDAASYTDWKLGVSKDLGFGVATQLCFLVPLGAVATMPAAVAGATVLGRELLADATAMAPEKVDRRP